MWKDLFLKILIVSYTIWVAITFSPLLHRAVLPLSATNQPPIRPRRLLLPNRACFAPIVNSFTCVCDIKHFSEHIVPKTTFSVSRPRWLEWRQIRRRPLRRSNPCWYLMLSPCLNCHWDHKCNLEAVNFDWECVTMVFIVSLETFSYLFDYVAHKGLYTGMSICKSFEVLHSYQPFSESSMTE